MLFPFQFSCPVNVASLVSFRFGNKLIDNSWDCVHCALSLPGFRTRAAEHRENNPNSMYSLYIVPLPVFCKATKIGRETYNVRYRTSLEAFYLRHLRRASLESHPFPWESALLPDVNSPTGAGMSCSCPEPLPLPPQVPLCLVGVCGLSRAQHLGVSAI